MMKPSAWLLSVSHLPRISAASRPHLGCISPASRLHLRRWLLNVSRGPVIDEEALAADAAALLIECAMSDGRFEVRSVAADAVEDATVHCSGATAALEVWHRVDHASLRTLARAADVRALYDGFDAAGLEYGPGYRTLMQVWSGSANVTAAQLLMRPDQQGTCVHPAGPLCHAQAAVAKQGSATSNKAQDAQNATQWNASSAHATLQRQQYVGSGSKRQTAAEISTQRQQ